MIVKRLLTAPIAGKERLARARIVQRKGKHPIELLDAVLPHSSYAWTMTSVSERVRKV